MRKRRHDPLPDRLPAPSSHQLRLWGRTEPGEPGLSLEPVFTPGDHEDGEDHAAEHSQNIEQHQKT